MDEDKKSIGDELQDVRKTVFRAYIRFVQEHADDLDVADLDAVSKFVGVCTAFKDLVGL